MSCLLAALLLSAALTNNAPEVQNPGFEASPFLSAWTANGNSDTSAGRSPTFTADTKDAKEGRQSLAIEALDAGDSQVSQKIFLPLGSLWRITAWVKSEDLTGQDASRVGGFISVDTPIGEIGSSDAIQGTSGWHEEQAVFRVPSPGFINLTLVGTRHSKGKVWFDGVHMEPLRDQPAGEVRIATERLSKRSVDPKQQGQFIELLCNLIPSIIAQQVASTSFEEAPLCRVSYKKEIDEPHRPWYPDGAVEVAQYSFDKNNPFNGDRSQEIELPSPHARAGISQDGFYLREGVDYKLRLHMRGEGNVKVWATLHGGGRVLAGPALLGRAGESWSAAEVQLRALRGSQNATLTIDFEGPGTLWLDRVYLIGSDAVLGIWRPDIVTALKAMHPGIIRFGGSTTEQYEWDHGIGPWDERQPFTTVWGGLEENFIGIDEFLRLCEYIGAEPLICVRWTGKTPEDAAAQVEYCNASPETRWGKLRAQNGHPQSYHVKYWQIGNEVDIPQYNHTVADFAAAMRKADPSIKLLSSFPTKSLLAEAGTVFDYLCPHHYEVGDLLGEDRDFRSLADWIAAHDRKDARLAVTEWNTTAGDFGLGRGILQTLGNALSISRYLNLLQRHADLVEIANRSNFADSFGSGFLLTGPGWMYRSPAYYAQQLYSRAADSFPLRLERTSKLSWQLQEPDLSATLSADGKTLRIYGVNSTPGSVPVHFRLEGFNATAASGSVYVLEDREHGQTAEVMNSRDDPERVSVSTKPVQKRLQGQGSALDFAFIPLSVTLVELKLR